MYILYMCFFRPYVSSFFFFQVCSSQKDTPFDPSDGVLACLRMASLYFMVGKNLSPLAVVARYCARLA